MPRKKISKQKNISCIQNRFAKQNLTVYRCVPEISKHSFAVPQTKRYLHSFVIHDYN